MSAQRQDCGSNLVERRKLRVSVVRAGELVVGWERGHAALCLLFPPYLASSQHRLGSHPDFGFAALIEQTLWTSHTWNEASCVGRLGALAPLVL